MRLADFKVYRKFLSKNKLYTLVTIMGFAISLMFVILLSVYVKEEFSTDKFHVNKDRIYLMANSPENGSFANPAADMVKENIPEVESFTRLVAQTLTIEDNNNKIPVEALYADSAFFTMFSFELLEGNPSTVFDVLNSVVVSKTFANKMFRDENPIGKFLDIGNNTNLTITGVMEDFPRNTIIPQSEIVINYQLIAKRWHENILTDWGNSSFTIFFMAKEGSDLPSKAPVIIDMFLKNNYWLYKEGFASEVLFIPLEDVYFSGINVYFSELNNNSKAVVSVYLIITILILMVAILNYINLSVSQTGKRGKEAALRKLMGSSKSQIMRQFIGESLVMTCISFILGLFFAFLAEPFFNDALNTELNLKSQFDASFTIGVIAAILIIAFVSGLAPAMAVSHFKPLEVVKGTYNLKVKSVYSKVLISFQYIVAITLLTCSFFIVKQTFFMKNYDLGFSQDNIFIMENKLNGDRFSALRNILEDIPGVEKVIFSTGTPVDGGNNSSFEYNGEAMSFQTFTVDTAFFDIFNIKVRTTGAPFAQGAVILNQKGYDMLRPDSITQTFRFSDDNVVTVAGVTDNFHIRSLHNDAGPLMIWKRGENDWAWSVVVKITGTEPLKVAEEIKTAYSKFIGDELFNSRFVDETVQSWYENEDRTIKILSAFTLLTFIILLMGIFAMSQYYVRQKEKEIGVRKVNGATENEIMSMLNLNFIRWIFVAFFVSVPIIYFVMHKWLESFPYKTVLSWWIYAATGIAVLLLSAISISVQTWRAANANPVDTLKSE